MTPGRKYCPNEFRPGNREKSPDARDADDAATPGENNQGDKHPESPAQGRQK